jgi:hypothetical protein
VLRAALQDAVDEELLSTTARTAATASNRCCSCNPRP